jgi:hypothetical protein
VGLLPSPAKSRGIQIMDFNFHTKNFEGTKLHIRVPWQSKREGNFCTLDLNFLNFLVVMGTIPLWLFKSFGLYFIKFFPSSLMTNIKTPWPMLSAI